ncbi:hypothetical protein GCM10028791_24330 [Echinicola sediminis]
MTNNEIFSTQIKGQLIRLSIEHVKTNIEILSVLLFLQLTTQSLVSQLSDIEKK